MADAAHARSFGELRPVMLAHLMDVRSSLDSGLAQLDETAARVQLDALLGQIQAYLASGDAAPLRTFLRSFLTLRAAQGLGADTLLHAAVAIGDTCVQVVQRDAGAASAGLACAVTHTGAAVTRLLVEYIADALDVRNREHQQLIALEGLSP